MSVNADGPAGTVAALRSSAAPMNTIPVGAGALIGPDGGQVAGLVGESPEPAAPGAAIDDALASLGARVTALEHGEAGEVPS